VQAGYNWQLASRWLIGVEGDFSWTRVNGSQTYSPIPPGPTTFATPPSFVTMSREVKWLASLRGRLGFTWDPGLIYGTGGMAFSQANYLGQDSRAGGLDIDTASFRKTSIGWVAGGGVEYALAANWSIRGEYLYYDTEAVSQIATPSRPSVVTANFDWDR